jgi:hypothetical protein
MVLTLCGLFVAAPLVAQEHRHEQAQPDSAVPQPAMDMMGRMGQMMTLMAQMHGMMGGEAMSGGVGDDAEAGMPLRLSMSLGLTGDQVGRIDQIEERSRAEHGGHLRLAIEAEGVGIAALQASSPNLQEYEARAREAASHRVEAQLALARGSVQAREVLTGEQREKLRSLMEAMHELTQAHH